MEMIQFGAANVFRASDGDGDAEIDIDAVLSHGEKRTKEVMDQLETLGGKGEEVRSAVCMRGLIVCMCGYPV